MMQMITDAAMSLLAPAPLLAIFLGTLGGIRTTFTHPRTAFVNNFSAEELDKMGLAEGLVRISVGAEDSRDLIEDLRQALAAMGD